MNCSVFTRCKIRFVLSTWPKVVLILVRKLRFTCQQRSGAKRFIAFMHARSRFVKMMAGQATSYDSILACSCCRLLLSHREVSIGRSVEQYSCPSLQSHSAKDDPTNRYYMCSRESIRIPSLPPPPNAETGLKQVARRGGVWVHFYLVEKIVRCQFLDKGRRQSSVSQILESLGILSV